MSEAPAIPGAVRVALAHAVVQRIAEDAGVDVLHIKGPAVHPGLRTTSRGGSDVDIVVRPTGVDHLMAALGSHGWRVEIPFDAGSAFDHAANLLHVSWGRLDVHRHYPGMERDPAAAFERLWRSRGSTELAHVPCAVPEPLAQSLILLLHAARSPHAGDVHPDVAPNWTDRTAQDRDRIRALADETGATIGLAAATGTLDEHAGDPEAALWEVFVHGGDRLDEWNARFHVARGARAKASVAVRSLRVNRHYLGERLGHDPSRREMATEGLRRFGAALRGLTGRMTARVTRR